MMNELVYDEIRGYFDYINEECNTQSICRADETRINITKTLVPVKSLFFRKYGKEIKNTFDELTNKTQEELEQILVSGHLNEFKVTINSFNVNYDIKFIDNNEENMNSNDIKMEEIIIDGTKVFILANTKHDEKMDKLYYGKLFSTSVQRMRKEAELHPWNKINIYWKGTPKYEFNEEMLSNINKIVKMDIFEYDEKIKEKIFFEKNCEKINLKIFFEKCD